MNKKYRIELRLTGLEKSVIKKKAENSGLNISEYCRRSSLNRKISYRMTSEEMELYKMMVKYKDNFVSISNLLERKNPDFAKEVRNVANDIKTQLKKLQ